MRVGDLGCGSRFVLFVVVVSAACLLTSLLSGCGLETTEWSVIHEGVLVKADVGGGQYAYLNISFDDGFTIPLYYPRFESPVGWTIGTRHRLEERLFESNTRYRLVPVIPLKAEADGPNVE